MLLLSSSAFASLQLLARSPGGERASGQQLKRRRSPLQLLWRPALAGCGFPGSSGLGSPLAGPLPRAALAPGFSKASSRWVGLTAVLCLLGLSTHGGEGKRRLACRRRHPCLRRLGVARLSRSAWQPSPHQCHVSVVGAKPPG